MESRSMLDRSELGKNGHFIEGNAVIHYEGRRGSCVVSSIMEPTAKKIFKGIVFLEVAGVFGAYALFHKMNVSQDFRHTMNRRFPSVLEVYYKSNEWAGIYGIRENDAEAWTTKKD
ncbi:hypothetical protein XENTR_v10013732 [Xenopus tropicalis]|uniref:CEBPZ opposite strand n=1 Tax=Xenopus tropicalis TaxID=8364 RepID=A0A6I8QS86_XENTR|nr:protein CEBPZOS isoform X1 [Xenopus tropicalis]KAE8601596.1 hypothetical protein XENTR_v10013732 [Xenopus tropicalis]|eukprot:XP_012819120.1 PREDICTED: protein CEBPZOS isoform X1 [Xenopus tropicalis]